MSVHQGIARRLVSINSAYDIIRDHENSGARQIKLFIHHIAYCSFGTLQAREWPRHTGEVLS